MSLSPNHQELESGIKTLGLNCSTHQVEQLITYLEMLQRWNKAYNLTAIREPIQMVRLHLLDSNGKKTRFLFQAINDLSLANAKEINQRVEKYQPEQLFDIVLSRAFSSISDMLTQCNHLVSDSGCFLAMKGKKPDSELSQIAKDYKVVNLSQINVPQVDSERHLVKITKTGVS